MWINEALALRHCKLLKATINRTANAQLRFHQLPLLPAGCALLNYKAHTELVSMLPSSMGAASLSSGCLGLRSRSLLRQACNCQLRAALLMQPSAARQFATGILACFPNQQAILASHPGVHIHNNVSIEALCLKPLKPAVVDQALAQPANLLPFTARQHLRSWCFRTIGDAWLLSACCWVIAGKRVLRSRQSVPC